MIGLSVRHLLERLRIQEKDRCCIIFKLLLRINEYALDREKYIFKNMKFKQSLVKQVLYRNEKGRYD